MRWLKKREVVIYFLLYRKFQYNDFNLGEALDTLSPYFSKKVSLNSIKYLTKIGLINKIRPLEYKLSNFEDYIYLISYPYLKRRARIHQMHLHRKTQ
ncbi:hypothetical protein B6F84_11510 [Acidianus manzaensis]|uniref:Plasmid replication protein RepL domain-containing protein n=1 Tax=Acidianus manzaensis TaxID=282676 RepID=A0A1W6K218_9CREN|nr:hypothetical protein B6F84_11510 [Acidianus manzaensis]